MLAFISGFLPSLGWSEILILGIIGVLLFGKRLPEIGRTLGKSIVSFRKGMTEMKDEITKGVNTPVMPSGSAENNAEKAAAPIIEEIKIDNSQNLS